MNAWQFGSTLIWQVTVLAALGYLIWSGVLRNVGQFSLSSTGISFELREVRREQARLTRDVEALRFLVSGFVTDNEMMQLEKFANPEKEFRYERSNQRDHPFVLELIRLWSLGLIEKKGIVSFRQTPLQGNMHDFAAITERGRKYLQLRNEMLQEGVSPAG
jgi:hypothetical protein